MMLIAGLALGSSITTLYWSSQMTRQFKAQAEWKAIIDKQSITIKEQSDALKNLMAATGRLIEATKPPNTVPPLSLPHR